MTLKETFEEITDDRIEGRTKHKLVDILIRASASKALCN